MLTRSTVATLLALTLAFTAGCAATTSTSDDGFVPVETAGNSMDEGGDTQIAEAAVDEEEKIICKRIRTPASNFRRKVCGTAADWGYSEEQGKQAGAAVRQTSRMQSGMPCGAPGPNGFAC